MRFDLEMICELCSEVGLHCIRRSSDEVMIRLEAEAKLLFCNEPNDDDSFIGFEGTPWHTHDELMCSDRHGYHIELNFLDVISGIADGTVLICELWVCGKLADRWLVHRDFVNEFRHLQNGDEIRVRPVSKKA
jgi:hypothetical protein